MTIHAFSGGLTRPMPQYGAANGRGITLVAFDDKTGQLSPRGRHLVVANQNSDTLTVFRVDQRNGTLSRPLRQLPVWTPMAIKLTAFQAG